MRLKIKNKKVKNWLTCYAKGCVSTGSRSCCIAGHTPVDSSILKICIGNEYAYCTALGGNIKSIMVSSHRLLKARNSLKFINISLQKK